MVFHIDSKIVSCKDCEKWVVKRRRAYDDGSERITFEAQPGKGFCGFLEMETRPEFGCNQFSARAWDHVETSTISGNPWEYFTMGACPDCQGRGSGLQGGSCRRCAGTGKVRFYEDGYIGEEQTRRHPKEPEAQVAVNPGTVLAPVDKPNPADQPSSL